MKRTQLLILGKCPLPVGGVTIHVKRLLEWLDYENIKYKYYDLKKFNIFTFLKAIKSSEYAHLHSSSPFLHIIFCLICIVCNTKSILTFHGNIGRFGTLKNLIENYSIKLSYIPIVLNAASFERAKKYNPKVILQSAYIPELVLNKLDETDLIKISAFRKKFEFIACTNASGLNYDSSGNEIYGIFDLIEYFTNNTGNGLIISDPSGKYHEHIKVSGDNIMFIDKPHDFICVLKYNDCFIRYTSTDGDSISIHEAIESGIPVIATDVVSRPNGVYVVRRGVFSELDSAISSIHMQKHNTKNTDKPSLPDIIRMYIDILNIKKSEAL